MTTYVRWPLLALVTTTFVGCDDAPMSPPFDAQTSDAMPPGSTSDPDPDPTVTSTGMPPTSSTGDDVPSVPTKRCVELIDDMEAAMTLIPANGTPPRQGAWFVYNDETAATQVPEVGMPFTHDPDGAPTSDGGNATLFSARTRGREYSRWGAGMGFNVNDAGCMTDDAGVCLPGDEGTPMPYDVRAFSGISFYARSYATTPSTVVAFKIVTEGVVPTTAGGTCEPIGAGECDAAHETRLVLTDTWSPHEITFEELVQPPYAGPNAIDFDPTRVFALQWQVAQNVDFDFAVDEICFF